MAQAEKSPVELPAAPAPPPRVVSPLVLRKSWFEPRVRFWWLVAFVLAVSATSFLVVDLLEWNDERYVIQNGATVEAVITMIGEGEAQGRSNIDPTEFTVTLSFNFENQDYTVKGFLEGPDLPRAISLKDKIEIKIDPRKPSRWTFRKRDLPPLSRAFFSTGLVLPFALAAALVSGLIRRRVLGVWRDGKATLFVVHAIGQSALAPRSRVLRCLPAEGQEHRLVQVHTPRRLADFKPGDYLWLIHHPGNYNGALPALVYDPR